jgi:hypothetical protein
VNIMRSSVVGIVCLAAAVATGCSSDDNDDNRSAAGSGGASTSGGSDSAGKGSSGGGSGGTGSSMQTLCDKYGGAVNVATVVSTHIIGTIAADCRISTHFTSLDADTFTHVGECLTIQVQELFGCEGVEYAGAMSSLDRPCRPMATAHQGLGISKGDFDALIEDVVSGLSEAGVETADIMAAAPALLGMEPAIVEDDTTDPTQATCEGGAGGAP